MSDSANLLQQLMDLRRKVANVRAEKLSGGKKKRKKRKKRKSPKRKSPKRKSGGSQAQTTAGIRRAVWEGRLSKTKGGLTKKDLMVSKSTGKIVSKKASAAAKKRLRNPRLKKIFEQHQRLMKQGHVRPN